MHSALFPSSSGRPVSAHGPRIAIGIARVWLALGSVALLCLPGLRGDSTWIGWLPFWLVVAPLADLLILRWRSLVGWSCAIFATLRRHRPRLRRAASRRVQKPRAARRKRAQTQIASTLTALLSEH